MISQKRYSLDEAVLRIKYETGIPHSNNGLLQLAKNHKIGICFFVNDENLKFIVLDKLGNKWKSVVCNPLFGEYSLKRVVIPIDKPYQDSHSINTINPRDEEVFPILNNRTLLKFANNPEIEIATIMPWSLSATSEERPRLEVAIVQQKMVGNSVHAEYTEWQKERGLPTFSIINEKTKSGTATARGNFKYFETWTTIEIKRSDLCIIESELSGYIERVLAEKNKPDRIQEAITEIKEITGRTFTPSQLFRRAKEGELFISFNKPEQYLKYVQMDFPNHEHKVVRCEPLKAWLILPKYKNVISDIQESFEAVDEKIYPILEGQALIDLSNLHKKEIKIKAWDIQAKDKEGNNLIVSSYALYRPAREGHEYDIFTRWLIEHNLPTLSLELDEPDNCDESFLNCSWAFYFVCGTSIELDILDLFIPRFSLERFIQNLNPQKIITTPKRAVPTMLEKRINSLEGWIDKQEDFDPHNHDKIRAGLWEELSLFDSDNFKTQTTSTLGSTPEAFFKDKKVKKIISFNKSSRKQV